MPKNAIMAPRLSTRDKGFKTWRNLPISKNKKYTRKTPRIPKGGKPPFRKIWPQRNAVLGDKNAVANSAGKRNAEPESGRRSKAAIQGARAKLKSTSPSTARKPPLLTQKRQPPDWRAPDSSARQSRHKKINFCKNHFLIKFNKSWNPHPQGDCGLFLSAYLFESFFWQMFHSVDSVLHKPEAPRAHRVKKEKICLPRFRRTRKMYGLIWHLPNANLKDECQVSLAAYLLA